MSFLINDKLPLDYARLLCDAVMEKYTPAELPPQGVFFYHQGVFLSGMERLYELTGDKKYFNYIKRIENIETELSVEQSESEVKVLENKQNVEVKNEENKVNIKLPKTGM